MNRETILAVSQGLFGQISIRDALEPRVRLMKINQEIEGQVFLLPNAASFSYPVEGPGAISASRYMYAFIIAAWQFPNDHGLVLGLGAGVGVTMLLALFPNLSLTVIEIDPQVISLARQYFPLISFYESQGRLQIIESAAEAYVDNCSNSFAFTLLDLFSGDEENYNNLPLIPKILKISSCFMANVIASKVGRVNIERSLNLNDHFKLSWVNVSPVNLLEKVNWVMTNIHKISPEILEYTLFANIKSKEHIMTANKYFKYILSQIEAACFYR